MELTPGLRRLPPPDLESVGQDEALAARIRDEIRRDGPITFARFMDLALYDPDGGYYRSNEARPGRTGDFLTAPETHPIFGGTLSRFVEDAWRRLDRPSRFIVREHGAGEGALATSSWPPSATPGPSCSTRSATSRSRWTRNGSPRSPTSWRTPDSRKPSNPPTTGR